MERETSTLEWKENISNRFLKTVSAYANYGTGKILFGVDDTGVTVGLDDPVGACLRIENMINDSLDPCPQFTLEPDPATGIVTLTVYEGPDKPYLYSGKAYRRSDSASTAVDRLEYGHLVLQGTNQTYDRLPSAEQDLSFDVLEARAQEKLGISALDGNVMRSLGLAQSDGTYVNAAALLADVNAFPGTDVTRFGASISEIQDRESYLGTSVISQLEGTMGVYRRYYHRELIEGSERKTVELVPEDAFREALANAIVHRTWDVRGNITVSMFPDRIEVTSPGGLPEGITPDEYLGGHVSVLRNPVLAGVFFRLDYIETLGTGILRIRRAYEGSGHTPSFELRAASIVIGLPVIGAHALRDEERLVLDAMPSGVPLARASIERRAGIGKDRTLRALDALLAKGIVEKTGRARATRYTRR